eukprot:81479_1
MHGPNGVGTLGNGGQPQLALGGNRMAARAIPNTSRPALAPPLPGHQQYIPTKRAARFQLPGNHPNAPAPNNHLQAHRINTRSTVRTSNITVSATVDQVFFVSNVGWNIAGAARARGQSNKPRRNDKKIEYI